MLPGQLDMFAAAPAAAPVHPDDTIEFKPRPVTAPTRYEMLDVTARRVAMASYLYYRLDVSMFSDPEFDRMCQEVADAWDRLEPIRQFMFGLPAEIRASGNHVKVTTHAVDASHIWLDKSGQPWNRHIGSPTRWKRHKEFGRWTTITSR